MTVKDLADGIVLASCAQCVLRPLHLIFNGQLDDLGAVLAGMIILAAALFGEFYFREADDAL